MAFSGEAAAAGVEAFRQGIVSNRKRRQDFEDRVNEALFKEEIEGRRTQPVFRETDTVVEKIGEVPKGSELIRRGQPVGKIVLRDPDTKNIVDPDTGLPVEPGGLPANARIGPGNIQPKALDVEGGGGFGRGLLGAAGSLLEKLHPFYRTTPTHTMGGLRSPSQTEFPIDDLPDPSSLPEGTIATDDETGESYIIRNGQWVRQ